MNKQLRLEDVSAFCVARMVVYHLWMVAAAAAICAMCMSMYCDFLHQPAYQAGVTYAVTAKQTTYGTSRNNAVSQEVIAVITELIGTDVLQEEIQQYSADLADFDGTLQASRVGESNMIVVTATADNPEQAYQATEALVAILPEFSDFISGNAVLQLMQNPTVSPSPVNGLNARKLCLYVAVAGAGMMIALLAWFSISRETIQTRTGARHLLDAPVIAAIGHEQKNRTLRAMLKKTNKGLQVFAPSTSFAYSEQINTICARLEHEAQAHQSKIFLVTGVGENEGKSTIAANVAALLAMKGKNVALVDADLRKPALYRFFDGAYQSELPLNRLLEESYSRENVLQCMQRHPKLGLYMLFSTGMRGSQSQLLTGETMQLLLQQLRVFDYVILDTPPMGFFADTEALADLVDASLLVVRQDYTAACDVNDAADALRASSSRFLGCVLNDMRGHGLGAKGYGYGYGYGYGTKQTQNNTASRRL